MLKAVDSTNKGRRSKKSNVSVPKVSNERVAATQVSIEFENPHNLIIEAPFSSLFTIEEDVLSALVDSMEINGYDETQPVTIWKETGKVIDGITRTTAAKAAGISNIPIIRLNFKSGEDALLYAITRQIHRRNITDGDMIRIIKTVDIKKKPGIKTLAQDQAKVGKSAEITAEVLGTSKSKVEAIRYILKYGDVVTVNKVELNSLTINAAYNQIKKQREEAARIAANNTSGSTEDGNDNANPVPAVQPPASDYRPYVPVEKSSEEIEAEKALRQKELEDDFKQTYLSAEGDECEPRGLLHETINFIRQVIEKNDLEYISIIDEELREWGYSLVATNRDNMQCNN